MDTSNTTNDAHHWSNILRLLTPWPVALGMGGCLDPTGWQAMRTTRRDAQQQPEDDDVARRAER